MRARRAETQHASAAMLSAKVPVVPGVPLNREPLQPRANTGKFPQFPQFPVVSDEVECNASVAAAILCEIRLARFVVTTDTDGRLRVRPPLPAEAAAIVRPHESAICSLLAGVPDPIRNAIDEIARIRDWSNDDCDDALAIAASVPDGWADLLELMRKS